MKNTKFIGILIAGVIVVRFFIAGAVFTSLPLSSDNAYAQQELQQVDVDGAKRNVLDYELLQSFEKRKKELDLYEEDLKKKESRLTLLTEELGKRLARFEKIKTTLEDLVKVRKDLSERSLKHLVKVYETMKPAEAAPLIELLDRDITISILSTMKGKNVGKILSKVDPGIATRISEQIAKRK